MPDELEPPMTAIEIAVAEANAVALGVPIDALMENAGRAVAEEVARRRPAPARVGVIVGPGNNGGDATAAAHYLAQWGFAVEVWLLLPPSEIRSASARRCFERISRHLPIHVGAPSPSDLAGFDLVLDGLLGTGQLGPLRAPYRPAAAAVRESRVAVLAIDVPTGLFDPEGIRPKWTVALTALKSGMTPATCGEITVREIGIPIEARRGTGPGDLLYFPTIVQRGRRGRSGRIIVVGGGPYSGAPALAALAALRTGAERATVIAPAPAADRIQGFSPNLIVRAVAHDRFRPRDVKKVRAILHDAPARAVVIGMGAGRDPETIQALRSLLEALAGTVPLVVDADGLDALPREVRRSGGYDLVATPNAGEFARVFGGTPGDADAERLASIRRIAAVRGITLLVKGHEDLISDGRLTAVNSHHHPAMTVSGAGDVLAGAVGALLADGVPVLGACRLASYVVGEAGARAAESLGMGLTATDILERIPGVLVDGLKRLRTLG